MTEAQQQTRSVETAEAVARREKVAELDRAIEFGASGLEIRNLEQAARFASWAIESGLTKAKKPAEVVIALQMGVELGFSIMQSLQVVDVIDGKPALKVEAQAALVESDGALALGTKILYRFEGEGENLACIAWSHPKGGERIESEPVYLHEFKHLRSKDNWKNYPKRMLKARAVGWHVRDFYARSVRNLPTSEELFDIRESRGVPPERDVTPPKTPDPLLAAAAVPSAPDHGLVLQHGCTHPDGFSSENDSDARVCIHCGETEDAETDPA